MAVDNMMDLLNGLRKHAQGVPESGGTLMMTRLGQPAVRTCLA